MLCVVNVEASGLEQDNQNWHEKKRKRTGLKIEILGNCSEEIGQLTKV